MRRSAKKKTTRTQDAEIHELLDEAIKLLAKRVKNGDVQPSISDLARLLEIRNGLADRNPPQETIITWEEERPRKQSSRQNVGTSNVD